MSFRAKREILRCEHAEKRRFLPAVEMTDSLRRTFCESVKFDKRTGFVSEATIFLTNPRSSSCFLQSPIDNLQSSLSIPSSCPDFEFPISKSPSFISGLCVSNEKTVKSKRCFDSSTLRKKKLFGWTFRGGSYAAWIPQDPRSDFESPVSCPVFTFVIRQSSIDNPVCFRPWSRLSGSPLGPPISASPSGNYCPWCFFNEFWKKTTRSLSCVTCPSPMRPTDTS